MDLISLRTTINPIEILLALIVFIIFLLFTRKIYRNRHTGFYFIRVSESHGRFMIIDGSTSQKKLQQRFSAEDIVYVNPSKTLFYLILFSLPALAVIFVIFFQINNF